MTMARQEPFPYQGQRNCLHLAEIPRGFLDRILEIHGVTEDIGEKQDKDGDDQIDDGGTGGVER